MFTFSHYNEPEVSVVYPHPILNEELPLNDAESNFQVPPAFCTFEECRTHNTRIRSTCIYTELRDQVDCGKLHYLHINARSLNQIHLKHQPTFNEPPKKNYGIHTDFLFDPKGIP